MKRLGAERWRWDEQEEGYISGMDVKEVDADLSCG